MGLTSELSVLTISLERLFCFVFSLAFMFLLPVLNEYVNILYKSEQFQQVELWEVYLRIPVVVAESEFELGSS